MSNIEIEKRVEALCILVLSENEDDRTSARNELRELIASKQDKQIDNEVKIIECFVELGVPAHVLGHDYLVRAIEYVMADKTMLHSITKELYPKVAKDFGTTASRTERAIRHAIECCWDRGDFEVLGKYFGNTIRPLKGKPTNTEFIARIANYLK